MSVKSIKLNKFVKSQYLKEAVLYGAYATELVNVNDPYEWDGIEYNYLYRLACMTSSSKAMLLWSYYVNHQGCCVEYRIPQELIDRLIIRKVSYDETFIRRDNLDRDQVIDSLYHKGKEWEKENEYRAVYYEKSADNDVWVVHDKEVYLSVIPVSVTFGVNCHMSNEYIDNMLFLKEYIDNKNNPTLTVKKLQLSRNSYRLEEMKQYDFDEEIRRIEGMKR